MRILAIDPGPTHSGWVVIDHQPLSVVSFSAKTVNADVEERLFGAHHAGIDAMVIEMPMCMGMVVGQSILETAVTIGRFEARCTVSHHRVTRVQVKMAVCGKASVKDKNIRVAIGDLFGGAETAYKKGKKGTKNRPDVPGGALARMTSHAIAALAVGVTWLRREGHIEY